MRQTRGEGAGDRPRGRWVGTRALTAAAIFALVPAAAQAGPWVPDVGQGELLFSTTLTYARPFRRSNPGREPGIFRKLHARTEVTIGVLPRLALSASVEGATERQGGTPNPWQQRPTQGSVTLRWQAWREGPLALAFRAGLGARTARPGGGGSRQGVMAEAGLDLGLSFAAWERPAFASLSLGYRHRGGATADEVVGAVTLGLRPADGVLLLAQAFPTWRFRQPQDAAVAGRALKLQGSIVYEGFRPWSLQLGLVTAVRLPRTLPERGLVAGLWRRF